MPPATFLVTGATGREGGAVVRHLRAAGASIRVLVRNPKAEASLTLAREGIEVMAGAFDHPETLTRALAGIRGVFSVQPLMLGRHALREIEWGKRIADQSRRAGVAHFVYSSVLDAAAATAIPHFASKAQIENHIRSIGLPYTILQPAGFMENLLLPVVVKGIARGKLTLPNAIDAPQHLIAVDDIGAIASEVLMAPEGHLGKTISLVGDIVSTREQAAALGRVLGREMKPGRLPSLIVRLFLGRDLQRMFTWVDSHHRVPPRPGLMNFESWCRQNASQFGEKTVRHKKSGPGN